MQQHPTAAGTTDYGTTDHGTRKRSGEGISITKHRPSSDDIAGSTRRTTAPTAAQPGITDVHAVPTGLGLTAALEAPDSQHVQQTYQHRQALQEHTYTPD